MLYQSFPLRLTNIKYIDNIQDLLCVRKQIFLYILTEAWSFSERNLTVYENIYL